MIKAEKTDVLRISHLSFFTKNYKTQRSSFQNSSFSLKDALSGDEAEKI